MRDLFIGIVLSESAASIISSIQNTAQELLRQKPGFESSVITHGNSPAHITLVPPFETRTAGEDARVEKALEAFGKSRSAFDLKLSSIGSFYPHTILIFVKDQKRLLLSIRNRLHRALDRHIEREAFTPHVSVVRKFPENQFNEMREVCTRAFLKHSRFFPIECTVDSIALLQKEHSVWKVISTYGLNSKSKTA